MKAAGISYIGANFIMSSIVLLRGRYDPEGLKMAVRVARSAGFCFGVRRAVDQMENLLNNPTDNPIFTLGPIIHNPQVVADLERRGARVIERSEDAPEGATVVIRAHGVGRETIEILRSRGASVADATCPFVSRIHQMAQQAGTGFVGSEFLFLCHGDHPALYSVTIKTCSKLRTSAAGCKRAYLATPVSSKPASTT